MSACSLITNPIMDVEAFDFKELNITYAGRIERPFFHSDDHFRKKTYCPLRINYYSQSNLFLNVPYNSTEMDLHFNLFCILKKCMELAIIFYNNTIYCNYKCNVVYFPQANCMKLFEINNKMFL